MTADEFLVARLIRLYPPRFRARFGAEMCAAYLDRRDALAGSRMGIVRHALATIADLLLSLPPVHAAERRTCRNRTRRPRPREASFMQNFAVDLRHVIRALRLQPGFAVLAILTLALGIGANTAVFSVLNSVVLAPLPYDQPEQLVRLYSADREDPEARQFLTLPDLVDVRDGVAGFQALGTLYTYRESGGDFTPADGPPRRIRLLRVSSGYFPVLRATPLLGRTFTADEDRDGVTRVVLSYRLWREVAGADPAIVGRTIPLNGQAYEVIGVMRPGFRDVAGEDVAAWVPTDLQLGASHSRGNHYLSAIARLKPGVSLAQARAQVDAVMARLAQEYPNSNEDRLMRVVPLLDDTIGESRRSVYVLMGAAGLVLLIACLNVANLFLARSLGQARVLAIRSALGADRTRLVVQRLTESVLVALAGGLVGSLVAYWGVKLLLAVSPDSLARAEEVGFDPRLLGFALVTTVLTGLVFGAAPAWRAARVDPTETLHEGSRGNTGGRASRRVRDLLVAGQVAVALLLLTGAGVLMKSFVALARVDLGFVPERVETFEVHLPEARYADPADRVRLHERLAESLRALPGVERVGATSWLPANGMYHHWGVAYTDAAGARQWRGAQVRVIDGDFFEAVGIPLLRGRGFTAADAWDTAGVALISQALTQVFGDRDPLGQVVNTGDRFFRIIGVVADAAYEAGGARGPQIYLSHTQFAADRNWPLTYVVRTATDPGAVAGPARAALAAIDPALVLHRPRPLEDVVARHHARERFTLLLMGTFAAVALSLAAVGVYGVLSYAVSQRVHEIGVRMALGARPVQVRLAVLRHGVSIAAAGMAVGLAAAIGFSRVLETLVFGVSPRDPLVFGGVLLLLGVVVLAAGYLPARRATRVHPLEALRGE